MKLLIVVFTLAAMMAGCSDSLQTATMQPSPVLGSGAATSVFSTAAAGGHMGKPVPTGTITLDQANPVYGDTITFTTVYDPPQPTVPVYVQVIAHDPITGAQIWGDFMEVGGSMVLKGVQGGWTSGPANCHAELYYWNKSGMTIVVLATTDFAVGA